MNRSTRMTTNSQSDHKQNRADGHEFIGRTAACLYSANLPTQCNQRTNPSTMIYQSFAALLFCCLTVIATPGHARELAALILDGRNDHDWKTTTPILKEILEETRLFKVDVSTASDRREPYGDWNPQFSNYHVVVSNFSDSEIWPESLRDSFVDYLRGGGGFVAIHAATNTFGDWEDYCEMIGLGWRGPGDGDRLYFDDTADLVRVPHGQGRGAGHGPAHEFTIDVRDNEHPVTRGMPHKWVHAVDDLYHGQRGPAKAMTILATAYSAEDKKGTGVHEPMIWTVPYGKGRVFTTVMGDNPTSMSCVGFVTTVQRGAEWAATGKVTQTFPNDFPTAGQVSTRTFGTTGNSANTPQRSKDTSRQPLKTVRIAGIVLKWVRGNPALNFARIEPMIREAAANGAEIVVTTECFLDGYAVRDKSISVEDYLAMGEAIPDGEYFRKFADLARELGIYLALGLHEDSGNTHYNTAALIDPNGELVGKYHKHRLGHEIDRHTAGTEFPVFETPHGTVGMMICADRGRRHIWQGLSDSGADFFFCLSGGSFGPVKNDSGMRMLTAEQDKYMFFVHPSEFLAIAPNGSVADVQMLGEATQGGNAMLISEAEIGSARDQNKVCYFDLPVGE